VDTLFAAISMRVSEGLDESLFCVRVPCAQREEMRLI
jgi:hypothetical protein